MKKLIVGIALALGLALPPAALAASPTVTVLTPDPIVFGQVVAVAWNNDSPPGQKPGSLRVRCFQGSTLVYWNVWTANYATTGTHDFDLSASNSFGLGYAPSWPSGGASCAAEYVTFWGLTDTGIQKERIRYSDPFTVQ